MNRKFEIEFIDGVTTDNYRIGIAVSNAGHAGEVKDLGHLTSWIEHNPNGFIALSADVEDETIKDSVRLYYPVKNILRYMTLKISVHS